MLDKARREAERALPASRASILSHARDIVGPRGAECYQEMRKGDSHAPDFRPAPDALFRDVVLAELVADRPEVSKRTLALLCEDWQAAIG